MGKGMMDIPPLTTELSTGYPQAKVDLSLIFYIFDQNAYPYKSLIYIGFFVFRCMRTYRIAAPTHA